ncbi:MAG: hypothetical protein M3N95_03050, partial [Actinomycetota bacterium]|nr:hypothetical protein [Actinomycetota bacterium]
MTTPRGMSNFDEPAPELQTEPELRTSAGAAVTAWVVMTNRAPEPRVMSATALGVDAAWLPRPSTSRPLMPGEQIAAELTFTPAAGTVPARYPLAIAVQALDPMSHRSMSATAIAEIVLVVDAPGQIEVAVDPVETSATFSTRVTVSLHNTGSRQESVQIEAQSPEVVRLRLSSNVVDVPPGTTVAVPGRIHVRTQLLGNRSRFTYTVTARGSGAPRRAEASITTRAVFGANSTKLAVLVAVVTLWAAMALIFIPKLSSSIQNAQN